MELQHSQFAYLKNTKEIKHISEVSNGLSCDCVCLSCGEPLVAKQGKIKIQHFSHYYDSNCVGGTETLLHLLTKECIQGLKNIYIPKSVIKSTLLENLFFYEYPEIHQEVFKTFFNIEKIILECNIDKIKPDIKASIKYNNKEYDIFIEVAVTHFSEENKINYLIEKNKSCIEIDLHDLIYEIKDLSLNEIKNLIKSKLNDISFCELTHYWINQSLTKEEVLLLDQKLLNRFNGINKKIIDSIKKGFIIKHDFKKLKVSINKDNFFGKYERIHTRLPVKKDSFFEIIEIISKSYEERKIEAVVRFENNNYSIFLFINKENEDIEKNEIYIDYDIYDYVIEKSNYIKPAHFSSKIIEECFYDKNKILNEINLYISPKNEIQRYKNFIKELKGRNITIPNIIYKNDIIDVYDRKINKYAAIETPKELLKEKFTIKIKKTEIPDKLNPNIIKAYYNENNFLYIVFHNNIKIVKKNNIYSNRFKYNIPIIYFYFSGDPGFYIYSKNDDWSDLNYEWLYHRGFEKAKKELINKLDVGWNKGVAIFMDTYSIILSSKNKRNIR